MAYKQTIFLGKQCFFGTQRSKAWVYSELWEPRGKVAVCPVCGDIWFRALVQREDGTSTRFFVASIPCEQHATQVDCGTIGGPPGSILETGQSETSVEWNSSLPPELLARELALHLKYERLQPYYGWMQVYFKGEQ